MHNMQKSFEVSLHGLRDDTRLNSIDPLWLVSVPLILGLISSKLESCAFRYISPLLTTFFPRYFSKPTYGSYLFKTQCFLLSVNITKTRFLVKRVNNFSTFLMSLTFRFLVIQKLETLGPY